MEFGPLLKALWFVHPAAQLLVAGAMLWRKLHRKFPVFFAYVVSEILVFGVVYSASQSDSYPLFFYSYWVSAAVSLVLGFMVIHEIFLDVFRPYSALKDLGSVLFKWAALVMLLVGIVVAAAAPVAEHGPIVESVLTVQRCVRVIQVGLVLFLLVFSKYVGVSWRQYSFGMSLGFGFFASIELLAVALHTGGYLSQDASDLVNTIAYNVSILVWLTYSLLKTPAREGSERLLASQRWNQGLADIHSDVSEDSLIPMFEDMVDRAFSRTYTEDAPKRTTPR